MTIDPSRSRGLRLATVSALLAGFFGLAAPAAAIEISEVVLVSVASDGTPANDDSEGPAISADGRFVVFTSIANNLVPDDINAVSDVFLKDTETGETRRVSVASDGSESNGDSQALAVSADARFVVFKSTATNLVANDGNGLEDLFVHDLQSGETTRVSVSSDGSEAQGPDSFLSLHRSNLSADGRFVVFSSTATNLVADDTNGVADAFVHDRQTAGTTRISVSAAGDQVSSDVLAPVINPDGSLVMFETAAVELVPGDSNNRDDVFLVELATGSIERISDAPDGTQQNGQDQSGGFAWPSLSDDAGRLVFGSEASNLVPNDNNDSTDVFMYDRAAGEITRISQNTNGESDGLTGNSRISGNGRFVVYSSFATNIVPPTNPGDSVLAQGLLHDTDSGETIRVSGDTGSGQANVHSLDISADGLSVVFNSATRNLLSSAPANQNNVFLVRISESTGGGNDGGDPGGGGSGTGGAGGSSGGGAVSPAFGVVLLFLCGVFARAKAHGTRAPFYRLRLSLLLILPCHALAQEPRLQFERIEAGSRFENVRTMSMAQDTQGFLWFGSLGAGLARYDGYEFRIFQHDATDASSLAHNEVHHLNVDADGVLWVATAGGLSRYDPHTESFLTHRHDPSDPASLHSSYVTYSLVDRTGALWVGTDAGLARRDNGEAAFTHYALTPEVASGLDPDYVECMSIDGAGTLWIGTLGGGLLRYDAGSDSFTRFRHDPEDSGSLANDHVRSILEDRHGTLWVGTDRGLSRLQRPGRRFTTYLPDEQDPGSIKGSAIGPLYEDSFGNFWVAATNLGVQLMDRSSGTFWFHHHDPAVPTSIGTGTVWSVFEDRSRVLWMGTNVINRVVPSTHAFRQIPSSITNARDVGTVPDELLQGQNGALWMNGLEGADRFTPSTGAWQRFSLRPENPADGHNQVSAIHEDRFGNLWVANPRHLSKVDQATGKYTSIAIPNKPICIYVDTAGRLWLCVPFQGLVEMDFENGVRKRIFRPDADDPEAIGHPFIIFAAEDSSGRFWVGTYDGLHRFDPDAGRFKRYLSSAADPRSISSGNVKTVFEDEAGDVWFGTSNGLIRYVAATDDFDRFFNGEDPRFNNFEDIIGGDSGRLWLSHRGGLAEFRPDEGTFDNVSFDDGMPSVFGSSIVRDARTGLIYLTTANGLVSMDPRGLETGFDDPVLVLTDFRSFNQPVAIRPAIAHAPLTSAINVTSRMTLGPEYQVISFGFSALGSVYPERLRYAYTLEGFDDDWIHTGADRRIATYTGLPAGSYLFRVKAMDDRGAAIGGRAALDLTILPPWWQTTWAYLLYGLVALSLLAAVLQVRTRALRVKGIELERLVRERTVELNLQKQTIEHQTARLEELIAAKDRYITNISHEFRTPLTVILAPLDRLLSEADDIKAKRYMQTVRRNASRLLRLVDKLLGLSRIDSGELSAPPHPLPVQSTIRYIATSLESLAQDKRITLDIGDVCDVWVNCADDALDEIVINLVSNAIKYTPPGGDVRLSAEAADEGFVRITVTDTGYGIPGDQHENVFRRFYRVNDLAEAAPGSGIGLALVKELVAASGGTVTLESKQGIGTRVSVRLPAAEPMPEAADRPRASVRSADVEAEGSSRSAPPASDEAAGRDAAPHILIIEDNPDLCHYLKGVFAASARSTFAHDGASGVELAVDEVPDLIICDVMLPKLNGFEVTRQLKHDQRTCHIPIIMLTARTDQESRLRGLQELADDYIAKPFSEAELLQRVETLLSIREILRLRYSSELQRAGIDEVAARLTEKDRRFMERVERVLAEHFSEAEFSSAEFADGVAMSERQLQRKLKALVDHSPREYLRSYRLSKARELLAGGTSVTDAAFNVGFQSQSYFARCFKAQFGIIPSEVFEGASKATSGR